MFYAYFDSPIGRLLLAGDSLGVQLIGFPTGRMARGADPAWRRADGLFSDACAQLEQYFAGTRREFDFRVTPVGSPFQLRVQEALRAIPYGETRSYRDIAVAIGQPRAVRAVGGANGRNPLPIVYPCHRVIGAGGDLTGFGGGIDTKRWLLDFERSHSGLFGP